MNKISGFEKYLLFMANWIAKAIPNAKYIKAKDRSVDELKLIDDLFNRFTEITDAIDNLDLCLEFIKGRAPRKSGMKLDAYLTYHITFYLQEVYILNQRLDSYATIIMRRRKRLGESLEKSKYDSLLLRVGASFSTIVKVRGAHVHDRAFSDESMRGLSMYSVLANHAPEHDEWPALAKEEYREAKQLWVAKLEKNKQEIKLLLDDYFAFLYEEITIGSVAVLPNKAIS